MFSDGPGYSGARSFADTQLFAIVNAGASGEIDVVPDLSSDHDSEGPGGGGGQPFVGELSFSIPRASAVQIELSASPGQPAFVVPSEGQLARSLTGWIVLTATALVILLASLAGLGILAWWRLAPERN